MTASAVRSPSLRRCLIPALLAVVLLPHLAAAAVDVSLIVEPTNLRVHAWAGEDDYVMAEVNVTAVGGDAYVVFSCEEPLIPPLNDTLPAGERRGYEFALNVSRAEELGMGHAFRTCYVNDTAVVFEIVVEEPPEPGDLVLSSTSLTITAPVNRVMDYPALMYVTNGYRWTVEVRQSLAPAWIEFENLTLLPGETKPWSFRVDTRGLVLGAQYGGIVRYEYEVANHTFDGSFQVTLVVNSSAEGGGEEEGYYLVFQLLDKETVEPVVGAAVVVFHDSDVNEVRYTDSNGTAVFGPLTPQVYSYEVLARGYVTETGTVTLSGNRSVFILMRRSSGGVGDGGNTTGAGTGSGDNTSTSGNTAVSNGSTTTQTPRPSLQPGELVISKYNVSMVVPKGGRNSMTIPLVAQNGYVNLSVAPAYEQPDWITANLSDTFLFEGQAAFLVISASPPNNTVVGNYSKAFYLTHNGRITVITASVEVVEPQTRVPRNDSRFVVITLPNGSKVTYVRPPSPVGGGSPPAQYTAVPMVAVLLRGEEALVPNKEIDVRAGEVVYVKVYGDSRVVRVIPKGMAPMGVSVSPDGALVYKYQVKDRGAQLDVRLVYYNPVTGEEAYTRPEEYGFGTYRFNVVEETPKVGEKYATLKVKFGPEGSIDTTFVGKTLDIFAEIDEPNGTRPYDGSIEFKYVPDDRFWAKNESIPRLNIDFVSGEAKFAFKYAGRYIPQKPPNWAGKFEVYPSSELRVKPITVRKAVETVSADRPLVIDLTDYGLDLRKVEVKPRARYDVRGTKVYVHLEEGRSYEIYLYGVASETTYDYPAGVHVVVVLETGEVPTTLTSQLYGSAGWVTALAVLGLAGWFIYDRYLRVPKRSPVFRRVR